MSASATTASSTRGCCRRCSSSPGTRTTRRSPRCLDGRGRHWSSAAGSGSTASPGSTSRSSAIPAFSCCPTSRRPAWWTSVAGRRQPARPGCPSPSWSVRSAVSSTVHITTAGSPKSEARGLQTLLPPNDPGPPSHERSGVRAGRPLASCVLARQSSSVIVPVAVASVIVVLNGSTRLRVNVLSASRLVFGMAVTTTWAWSRSSS